MQVVLGKYAGFCGGVKVALQKAEESLNGEETVYCLGDIVHNDQVIENLKSKGMKIVYNINDVPDKAKIIIRAHGEGEAVYKKAEEKKLQIIDTTCGNVISIRNKIKKAKEDSFIIIIGEKGHPEALSHAGFAGESYYIIEDEDDILDAYMKFENTGLSKVYVIAQTTFSSSKFDVLEKEIYTNFIEADVVVDKTLCNATEIRQEECKRIAKEVNYMIIIGGPKSANTRKLVEISEANCKNVYFVQTVEELKDKTFEAGKTVGVMSGASTLDYITNEVVEYVKNI